MLAIITVLVSPLFILNAFGGVIAIVWLVFLGEWSGVGIGLVAFFLGTFGCSLILLPGMLFTMPAIFFLEKGGLLKILAFIFGSIGVLWTYISMYIWGVFSFKHFVGRSDGDSFVPYLLLAYSVATGPWAHMAGKEDNTYSLMASFFLQIACFVGVLVIGFTNISNFGFYIIFLCIMAIGFLVNLIVSGINVIAE